MSADPAFRAAVQADPAGTLAGFDLTEEEKSGLAQQAGAPDTALDQRVTKAEPSGGKLFRP